MRVPPTRSDVLHACDVVEDVAIAHGYNNVPTHVGPPRAFIGIQRMNPACLFLPIIAAKGGLP